MARGGGSGKGKGPRDALIEAMTRLIGEAKGGAKPVSKRVLRRLRTLKKELVAARATETRRLNQLSAAQDSKGGRHVARRTKQAGNAAREVATIAGKIAEVAAAAAGATRDAGTPAAPAVEAGSPAAVPSREVPARATARKPATTRKPAATVKPRSAAKPAATPPAKAATDPAPRKRPGSAHGSAGNSSS